MTPRRIAFWCFALGTLLSACSGFRSGPAIYSRVSLGSPWWGDSGAGAPADPDVDLPPETRPGTAPDAARRPTMGMPDAAELDDGDS